LEHLPGSRLASASLGFGRWVLDRGRDPVR